MLISLWDIIVHCGYDWNRQDVGVQASVFSQAWSKHSLTCVIIDQQVMGKGSGYFTNCSCASVKDVIQQTWQLLKIHDRHEIRLLFFYYNSGYLFALQFIQACHKCFLC